MCNRFNYTAFGLPAAEAMVTDAAVAMMATTATMARGGRASNDTPVFGSAHRCVGPRPWHTIIGSAPDL